MKRIVLAFNAAVICAALITACQQTPEKPVVIQKDMEQMIEKAQNTNNMVLGTPRISLRDQTGAPETLTLENTKGNFKISVDAVVTVPNADRMPIIRVQQGEFTQEQVTAYWNTLVGDTELWQRKAGMTKSEIEAKLTGLRRFVAEQENQPGTEDIVEQTKADIEALEKQYDSAPEEIQMEPADSTLRETEITADGNTYTCSVAGGNTEDYSVSFSVQNMTKTNAGDIINPARMGFSTSEANYNYGQVNTISVDENTQLDESLKAYIRTTPAQAKAIADDFLQKMNTPMTVYSIKLVNDEETGVFDGKIAPAAHYAYVISCVRTVEGVLPMARIEGSTMFAEAGKSADGQENLFITAQGIEASGGYMKQWAYESMGLMVNDSGIIEMSWSAPLDLLETKVEDSTLMPFSDIQAVFEKMMPITFETTAKGMDNLTCRIEDVRLEMMRIVEQGSIENGLLIPVWNFYGVRSRTYNGKTDDTGVYILLCLNAVDGSVIDISKGY